MAGIIGTGKQHLTGAMRGGNRVSELEQSREIAQDRMDQAERQQSTSTTMSGVGTGAMVGTQINPGIGTAIGAVVGGLVGWLGGEVF